MPLIFEKILTESFYLKTPSYHFYLSKANNRNTRRRCKICLKLTIKTPERHHGRRSGVFIVNFEHVSKPFFSVSSVSVVDFGQVNFD